jgi:Ca2+-binding EF-hand superfamily protein
MNLNLICISSEIYNIINNRKKYDNYTVLVCLAIRELIILGKESKVLSIEIIQYLIYIHKYIQCYIDFELLKYICNNKILVIISDNSELLTLSSSISSSSDDLEVKITKMLVDDSNTINKIYNLCENSSNNELAKNIFKEIDNNNDGLISAIDILHMIHNENNKFVFESQFMNSIINLLLSSEHDKINFDLFLSVYF